MDSDAGRMYLTWVLHCRINMWINICCFLMPQLLGYNHAVLVKEDQTYYSSYLAISIKRETAHSFSQFIGVLYSKFYSHWKRCFYGCTSLSCNGLIKKWPCGRLCFSSFDKSNMQSTCSWEITVNSNRLINFTLPYVGLWESNLCEFDTLTIVYRYQRVGIHNTE